MFTGIVERVGSVVWLEGGRLAVDPGDGFECAVGESVAVNGCCLTVASVEGGLQFDLSAETMRRTSVGGLKPGSKVNLERAVRADGRFGGHFVQGHVDAVGTLVSLERKGEGAVARFEAPTEFARYLVDKGSIAVDGISLTVVRPSGGCFEAWVVPHTLAATNLAARKAGDSVNLEFDIMAKYAERLLGLGPS